MSTSDRAVARRSLRQIALAGVVSLSMIGLAGVAGAQDAGAPAAETSASAEQVVSPIDGDELAEENADDSTTGDDAADDTATDGSSPAAEPPAGDETTDEGTTGDDTTGEGAAGDDTAGDETKDDESAEDDQDPVDRYDVVVNTFCEDGYGWLYVWVYGDRAGEHATATINGQTEGFRDYQSDEGDDAWFAWFDDMPAALLTVHVSGPGFDVTTQGDLQGCVEDAPAPTDEFVVTTSCVGADGIVTIQLYNTENDTYTTRTIKLDGEAWYSEIQIEAGLVGKISEAAPNGTYVIGLYDEEDTLLQEETVTIDCHEATTPPTTTPPAQGGPVPGDDDDLANTGAAVGGLAALGALALALGAALVLTGRRRAARTTTD